MALKLLASKRQTARNQTHSPIDVAPHLGLECARTPPDLKQKMKQEGFVPVGLLASAKPNGNGNPVKVTPATPAAAESREEAGSFGD